MHRKPATPARPPRIRSVQTGVEARPFIKWVGGKRQLLPELLARLGGGVPVVRYHEPFLGGGALFFALLRGTPPLTSATLSDVNGDLIATYRAVRDEVEAVITALQEHAKLHDEPYYYAVRAAKPREPTDLAAWFIYLNKTGFNGLYRVNRRGQFNVPFGSYVNPTVCDEHGLRRASDALAMADIERQPFESVLDRAVAGDLVYFDPPYVPVSATASFTSYSQDGFGPGDQERLAEVFRELDRKGVRALLSNSGTPVVAKLYAGFTTEEVRARRAVNSRADRRGEVIEYIVRNF